MSVISKIVEKAVDRRIDQALKDILDKQENLEDATANLVKITKILSDSVVRLEKQATENREGVSCMRNDLVEVKNRIQKIEEQSAVHQSFLEGVNYLTSSILEK